MDVLKVRVDSTEIRKKDMIFRIKEKEVKREEKIRKGTNKRS